MRIEKLKIKNFGKLKELSLEFLNGMNIVYGQNEAGKSTLQHFIMGMLFGMRGGRVAKDGSLPPLKKYKPWEGISYGGSLEYRLDDGESYRVERDFDNNIAKVYDSNFNDITNTFDANRQRGLLFSEKHLGINEICFEKTVFIKQMESRMDESGSKELISRLINLTQSGFEDVSLLKAQQTLKEALKEYVGTDKTSSRPLDRVIQRLDMLNAQRAEYIEKKSFSFNVENELYDEMKKRDRLQYAKDFLLRAKNVTSVKRELNEEKARYKELEEIIQSIETIKTEHQAVLKRLEEFNEAKRNFERFGSCSNEAIDEVSTAYNNMSYLIKEKIKLEADIESKRFLLEQIKQKCSNFEAFKDIDQSMEKRLLELPKEIESLKIEREKYSVESIEERLKEALRRNKRGIWGMIASAAIALIFLAAGIYSTRLLMAGSIIPVVLGLIFIFRRTRALNDLSDLKSLKNIAFAHISGIDGEIANKQKLFESILSIVGAAGIEDFFRLKSLYDSIKGQAEALEHEISVCHNNIDTVEEQIDNFKLLISKKFADAGIQEINEESINEFRHGVRKYWEMASSIGYAQQRGAELKDGFQRLYISMSNLCGADCVDIQTARGFLEGIQNKAGKLQEYFENGINELLKEFSQRKLSIEGLDTVEDLKSVLAIEGQENIIAGLYDSISENFNNLLLKITEHETIIKNYSLDENEIFNIEAKIEQLNAEKELLEDTSISLKTALDVLTESGIEIQKDFAPALNIKMSRIINEITSGKYSNIRADDHLMLKAVSGNWGDVVTSSSLSGGTVDQVYLAMRLSIAELISNGGETLPIILDEVFAQYDDVRTELALRYFKQLSHTRQIILFTCKKREVDIACEVSKEDINVIDLNKL